MNGMIIFYSGVIRFLAFAKGGMLAIVVAVCLLLFRDFDPVFAFVGTLAMVLGLCIGGLIGLFLIYSPK